MLVCHIAPKISTHEAVPPINRNKERNEFIDNDIGVSSHTTTGHYGCTGIRSAGFELYVVQLTSYSAICCKHTRCSNLPTKSPRRCASLHAVAKTAHRGMLGRFSKYNIRPIATTTPYCNTDKISLAHKLELSISTSARGLVIS